MPLEKQIYDHNLKIHEGNILILPILHLYLNHYIKIIYTNFFKNNIESSRNGSEEPTIIRTGGKYFKILSGINIGDMKGLFSSLQSFVYESIQNLSK